MGEKKCLKCNGSGKIMLTKFEEEILKDRSSGMSLRQIAKKHKKGTTTIVYHLNKINI